MPEDYGYCPRCGSKRPDGFRWCRKCGLDFQNPPKPDRASSAPAYEPERPVRIDVRPIGDRQSLARWTLDAFTVRCLGTVGGVVGMILGFFVFTALGGAMQLGAWSLMLGLIGIPLGFALGVRVALGFLAR